MVQDSQLQINLLGYRLRLLGPAAEIDSLKDSLYSRCQEPPATPPEAVYRLDISGEDYRVLDADGRGEPLYETDDRSDLYWWLENALCIGALGRIKDLLLIHGAAVERDGKALIFLGKSYSGKSTLTMHLLRSGYRLLSDEVVLIDPKTLKLRPFPRNLLVRQGALKDDSQLRSLCEGQWHYEDGEGEMKWMLDPNALNADGVAEEASVPLALLFIPHPMDVCETYDGGRVELDRFPDYKRSNLTDALQDIAVRHEIPFLNLFDTYRTRDSNKLFFHGGDDHWNASGQALAAGVLSDFLVSNGLLKAPKQLDPTGAP